MKKNIYLMAIAVAVFSFAAQAQTADPKIELASKVVALQQGPELDRLVQQLSGGATQELIASWGPKLEASVPKAKQKKASEDLNVELMLST